jgi:hypothetical protein
MDRLSEQTQRMFARVDAVLEAIENGEDPRPAARRLDAATPWDVIALGHAFVRDVIEREQRAESELSRGSRIEDGG